MILLYKRHKKIIPILLNLLLLLMVAACGFERNQGSVFERVDAGRAESDSLLFMNYAERLSYHYSVRSDSVLWYLYALNELAERNSKQLEVLWFIAGIAYEYMNAGEYALALEYYLKAFDLAEDPDIEKSYWTLGMDASPERRRLRLLSNLHFTYGHLMDLTENRNERLNQFRIANQIAIKNDDIINEAYTSDGLAMAYLEKIEPDSALYFINRSIKLYEHLPSRFYYSFTIWIQGNIFMEMGAYDDAI